MAGLFAKVAAKLGDGQAVSRFMQIWGGEHATSSSAGAASLSSEAAPSAAAVTHPRDWQRYTKEEWADWNAGGPRRKEAKVKKPEEQRLRNPRRKEEEEAKVEETYEQEEEVPKEEEVAKEEDVAKEEEVAKEEPNEEAEAEAREEEQVLATHDTYESLGYSQMRKLLRNAQQNPEPRDNRHRPRGGQNREYWQGYYDRKWREQGQQWQGSGSNRFGINQPPPPLPVQHRLPPPPPPPPPPIPQPSEAAREAAAVAEFNRRVFGGK